MATTAPKNGNLIPDFEAATEQLAQVNERLLEAGRKVTGAYLDGLEKYVGGLAQFERKLGEQSKVEAVTELLGAHAQLTEDITRAGVRAARELIAL